LTFFSKSTIMKVSAILIATIASTQAFAPVQVSLSQSTALRSSEREGFLEQVGDAVRDAAKRMDDADDTPVPGHVQNGLSEKEEDEMWAAQRELQANRNAHSSKESRKQKYSDEPVVENDKHGELKQPWTKSEKTEDHNSIRSKY
jgi:hypothetical protein